MKKLTWDQIQTGQISPETDLCFLTDLPLIVMVGLTGVGKTTVLENLEQSGLSLTVLPNRREITDRLIIGTLQQEAGQTPHPVTDRLERFKYTARYRTRFPGGMAYALSQLAVLPPADDRLIFDGLRGLEEVKQAVAYFPRARFILLDAPDMVRLQRLLHRGDRFDTAGLPNSPINGNVISALRNIYHIQVVFNEAQLEDIARLANRSPVKVVLEKAAIIVEERRHYDSHQAFDYLIRTLPPEQILALNTTSQPAEAIANQIATWLVSA
jgi:hypothetical protein